MSTPLIFMVERAFDKRGEPRPLAEERVCFKHRRHASEAAMRFLAALPLALAAIPAHAVPGGALETLALGTWFCELPGDAVIEPVARPQETFTAVPDSSYRTPDGAEGSYLLLGDRLTMTSGPREGDRYVMDSSAMVHKLDPSGQPGPLRCVRAGDPAAMALAAPQGAPPRP